MTCAVILLVFPAMASAQGAPTIQSDKGDYAPGELVTLTGSGWGAGESVNIRVNDDAGQTWSRNVDVVADSSGNISDSFNLPNWFVATYTVTASGASGTATTTFTDASVEVKTSGVSAATVSWKKFAQSGDCGTTGSSTNGITTGSTAVNDSAFTSLGGANNGQSMQITAPSPVSDNIFSSWSGALSSTSQTVCVPGVTGGIQKQLTANYSRITSTSLSSSANPSIYGNNVTFTATVTAAAGNPSGVGTVDFIKDGSTVICNDVALASGGNTATCETSSLGAGDHSITAEYSGTTGAAPRFAASTSSALTQDVDPRSVTASITAANKTYDGNTDAEITDCSLDSASGNTGVLSGDANNVDCSATNGQFESAGAGDGKTVTADVSLTGTAAGNYQLTSNTAETTANIDKAAGSVSINNLPSNATVGGSFTPTYNQLGDGTPSTTSNSTSICTVSGNTVNFIAAGTCKLQASVTEGTNHLEATGAEQPFTIAAATPMFNFTGFFSPIDNKDTYGNYVLNSVKAGSAVPVKFSLGGDKGLNIFTTGYPKSSVIPCSPTAEVDAIESTVTAGQSTLQYDAIRDQYTYVWKTEKSWTGCRQLEVKLTDGSSYRASFKFTK
jgi:hypothetical protein